MHHNLSLNYKNHFDIKQKLIKEYYSIAFRDDKDGLPFVYHIPFHLLKKGYCNGSKGRE